MIVYPIDSAVILERARATTLFDVLTHFWSMFTFDTRQKTPGNLWFFGFVRGYKVGGTMIRNALSLLLINENNKLEIKLCVIQGSCLSVS